MRASPAASELTADSIAALPFDQEWLFGMSLLAEASARVGDTAAAAVLYPPLLPWANLIVADYPEAIRGSVSRYLALLAVQLGLTDDADTHFRHALDMNERTGLRPWLAFTQADYAQMLLARGGADDGVRARQLLDSSDASCLSLGITRTPTLAALTGFASSRIRRCKAPQPMQVAFSNALSATGFGTGVACASGAVPVGAVM